MWISAGTGLVQHTMFSSVDFFGTGIGNRNTLGIVDCQWGFDGTVFGQFWTIIKIGNECLSVRASEFDKERPEVLEMQERVELGKRECKGSEGKQKVLRIAANVLLHVKFGTTSFAKKET